MSAIPNHELERLARLLLRCGQRDLLSELVRLLWIGDNECRAPKFASITR
jgi:hypothetical protein